MASEAHAALAVGAYAITGGLGGLGLRAAKMLVEGGASGVVLSSRSARLSGPVIDTDKRVMMRVAACDVGVAADAVLLLALAPPTGVLHAAGVLHDKMLRSMATDDVHAVFAPKALAASKLQTMVALSPLEAFTLFSSVASTFGNIGQANYAAANAYLDSLGGCRSAVGASAVCLVISGSGVNRATLAVMTAARESGARVIAITSFARSAVAESADIALVIPPVRGSFREELEHASRASLMLVTESVVGLLVARRGDQGRDARSATLSVLGHSLDE